MVRNEANIDPTWNSGALGSIPVLVIQPTSGWAALRLGELWEYRELLYMLIWRDVKVRYKQTALGVTWAVLQPLAAMVIFTIFFGGLAKLPSDGVAYPVFAYCGIIVWQLFARSLTEASTSLVEYERLITKVFFPRVLVPTAAVLAGTLDFAVSFVLLVGMLFAFGIRPSATVLLAPVFTVLAVVAALGVAYWLSAVDVEYRDVRYTIPLITQLWLFATPVIYSSSLVPEAWRALYGVNPMVGVIEGFRWAMLGEASAPSLMIMGVSVAAIATVFLTGLAYFRRVERTLADRI